MRAPAVFLAIGVALACGGDVRAGQCAATTTGGTIGDSIGISPTRQTGYAALWAAGTAHSALADHSLGGGPTSDILTYQWPHVDGAGFDKLIMNGGTNDCIQSSSVPNGESRATDAVTNMQTIATDADAQGMYVVVVDIPPIKGAPGWNSFMQACIDKYNTDHLSMTGVDCFVSSYDALDTDNDDDIDAGFDSGDGIHPNATGADAIRDAIVAACGAY